MTMSRRSFLKGLLGLAGLPIVTALPAKETRRLLIQASPVAGFQHHQGAEVWPQLRQGMTLDLFRQPQNKYDRRAVAVLWRETQLGYLPRGENHAVSNMLDNGQPLLARITRLSNDANPWRRIEIEVFIDV